MTRGGEATTTRAEARVAVPAVQGADALPARAVRSLLRPLPVSDGAGEADVLAARIARARELRAAGRTVTRSDFAGLPDPAPAPRPFMTEREARRRSRARRRRSGPAPKPVDVTRAARLVAKGWTLREVGDLFGVSGQTIANRLGDPVEIRARWRESARERRKARAS